MSFTRGMVLAASSALLVLTACGGGNNDAATPLAWQGEGFHIVATGKLNGDSLDMSLSPADANDATKTYCRREYEVPVVGTVPDYSAAKMVEIQLIGFFEVNGEVRRLELEHKMHDFQSDPIGTTTTVVPRDDAVAPASDEMWLEWEWHSFIDDATTYEQAAQEGDFTLEAFTGTPGADGVIVPDGEGTVGGVAHARWSATESMEISFTVPCGTNKITEIIQ